MNGGHLIGYTWIKAQFDSGCDMSSKKKPVYGSNLFNIIPSTRLIKHFFWSHTGECHNLTLLNHQGSQELKDFKFH